LTRATKVRAGEYCLDSWAVLRFLEGASGAARRVRQVMRKGRPVMSWVNLGEVYYVIHRAAGASEAETTVALLRPMLTLDLVTPERVLAAARIKASHPLAYGDAFAVATAAAHGAVLLTGDPEMTRRAVGCRVEDLGRL
jgi:predicted nucleic acid-binding protein